MNQTKDQRHALERWENEGGAPAAKPENNGLPNSVPEKQMPVAETQTLKIGPTQRGAHDRFFADLKNGASNLSASAAGGYGKLRPGLQAEPMTLPHPVVCRPEMRMAGTIHLPKRAVAP